MRRLLFVLGGTVTLSLGVLAACSDNGNFSQLPTSTNNPVDSGRDDDDTDPDDTDDQEDAGLDDAGCFTRRSNAAVFCFGARSVDGGKGNGCVGVEADASSPEICCSDEFVNGTGTPAKCVATTASTSGYAENKCGFKPDGGGREWHCLEPRNCPDVAPQCCVIKGTGGGPIAQQDRDAGAACNQFKNDNNPRFVGGTRCRTACETDELAVCGKDEDCAAGETCYVFNIGSSSRAMRFSGVCKPTR